MIQESSKLGFIGIGFGAVALVLAIVHFWAGPFSPQLTLEQTIAKKAVAIKKATLAVLKGKKVEPTIQNTPWDLDRTIDVITPLLGSFAVIFGVLSLANKESLRVASGAGILGGLAIAFQFATLALGAIIVVILVAVVLSQIGIS